MQNILKIVKPISADYDEMPIENIVYVRLKKF